MNDSTGKIYRGKRRATPQPNLITADGKELNWQLDIENHSPNGPDWGYGGSGPSQCALALLVDAVGKERAIKNYQQFKFKVIAFLDDEWEMSQEMIRATVDSIESTVV